MADSDMSDINPDELSKMLEVIQRSPAKKEIVLAHIHNIWNLPFFRVSIFQMMKNKQGLLVPKKNQMQRLITHLWWVARI